MIKIPGTDEGLPAIEQVIYEGINVNVTLLFSVDAYAQVAEAFIRGLERRHAEGQSTSTSTPSRPSSSRASTPRSTSAWRSSAATTSRGTAGLANARAAYLRFQEIFHGERFAALREAGAPVQRPLWASTGVKNPRYPDTMYVDGARRARRRSTRCRCRRCSPPPSAREVDRRHRARATRRPTSRRSPRPGIDLDDVTDKLLRDGIDAFVTPMEKLLAGIESKREAIVTRRPPTIESSLPDDARGRSIAAALRQRRRRGRRAAHLDARTTRSGAPPDSPRSPTGSAG